MNFKGRCTTKEYVDMLSEQPSFVRRPQNIIELIAAGIPPDCKCIACARPHLTPYEVMKLVVETCDDDDYIGMCLDHLLVIYDKQERKKSRLEKCMEKLHDS